MDSEFGRYSRNIIELGALNQEKLHNSSVLIMGLGGLGSGVLLGCAGLGVGKIGLVDFDVVQISNLNRQFIHKTSSLGVLKTKSASVFLDDFNPEVKQKIYNIKLESATLEAFSDEILSENFDVIIDCFDNFEGKFLLNKLAQISNKPLIHGGIDGFMGQVTSILPKKSACLNCFLGQSENLEFQKLTPSLAPVVNFISSIQVNECVKILLNFENTLCNKLLRVNLQNYEFKISNLKKNPNCKVCI